MKTDWFEMRDARLHLAPYSDPHFEIAVASTITPFGMIAAGTHGVGVLSIGAGLPGGPEALADAMEDRRGRRGEERQDDGPQELARRGERAHRRGRRAGAARSAARANGSRRMTYFEDTLGRPPGRADDPLRDGVKMGTTLVGSPETVVKGIHRLLEYSQGGFGGILFRAHEWANREQTMRSLRTVRALCDAGVPGLARPDRRFQHLGAGEPQAGVRPDGRGGEARVHRFRARGAGRISPAHDRAPATSIRRVSARRNRSVPIRRRRHRAHRQESDYRRSVRRLPGTG